MKRVLLASASALAIVTGSAFAADVIAPEPAAATWTGLHVGIGGGAGYNTYDAESEFIIDDDGSPLAEMGIAGDDLGAWYGFGTVEIGFDYQFADSPFVIGILANYDFNGSNDADAESFTFEDDGDFSESRVEAELDDSWFVGGRLGFAFQDTTLIYGLGGYTWVDGKVKAFHDFDDPSVFPESAEFDDEDNVDGWTIGGGIEHLITENLSLKVEYRHDFLDDIKWDEFAFDPSPGDLGVDEDNTHRGKVDFSRDTIRAVLSWRFNPGM